MNIDLGSLFFNASIETGGGTPSWGTALGQSAPDYKLTYPGAAEILIGMDYCYCPLSNSISCKLGKGGKEYKAIESQSAESKYEITKAAIFNNVYIKLDEKLISIDKPFILLVTRENENTHKGRRTLKYSDSTSIGEFNNKDFYDAVQVKLGGPNACWFAYAIDVVEQSKLIVSVIKVSDIHESYANPETRKKTWMSLLPASMQVSSGGQNFFFFNFSSSHTPSQIIYYGVPGCGKSNKIREQLKDVPEKNKVRVVFHPEYTNAEFIGQILPKVNGHVTYEFTPGPFTQIIKRAYLNPNEQFYLVIEEINRGNAAAIFGDTFQLLDRLKAGETDSLGNDPANAAVNTFTEGWSQYFVQNDDVNAYIRKTTELDDGSYQERNDGEPIEEIKIKEIHFNANTAIRLPPNLSILATMNTSDQNVFTLDNAFQRRFDMELVRNEFDLTKPAVKTQYEAEIDDTGIKWGQFWGWINAKITATLKGLSSTEDKRLGVWFVSNVGGIIDDKVFAEKVLKFLWDDVFKFKRPQIFADGIDTLEKLINFFEKPSEGKERFDVFKDKANLVAFVASPTL
ncbi:AAA family ATPase [Fibrobacter sp. UWB11]|uniref:AAA family ATPase n=1 Tax=Fibrobacter sp. UWB11 TaxID=1896202 RepID=UPI00092B1A6B|nr:AAA family ATPase [Fibrobacter sp. UWB11]SIO28103.1 AAA domain (dynein-related subfamily) [Fibrobacter sp. UWB11]